MSHGKQHRRAPYRIFRAPKGEVFTLENASRKASWLLLILALDCALQMPEIAVIVLCLKHQPCPCFLFAKDTLPVQKLASVCFKRFAAEGWPVLVGYQFLVIRVSNQEPNCFRPPHSICKHLSKGPAKLLPKSTKQYSTAILIALTSIFNLAWPCVQPSHLSLTGITLLCRPRPPKTPTPSKQSSPKPWSSWRSELLTWRNRQAQPV